MLPILRLISVGGVLLAISILALALIPPGASRLQLAQHNSSARGALIDRSHHPEWRQFLIMAALQRAGELDRLRSLPDTPLRLPEIPQIASEYQRIEFAPDFLAATDAPKVAGLPVARSDAGPEEEETGSIAENPGATIPIEIGAPSSSELPIVPTEESPPVVRLPVTERPEAPQPSPAKVSVIVVVPEIETREPPRRAVVQRPRRKPVAAQPAPVQTSVPPPFNILEAIFNGLLNGQAAPASGNSTAPQNNLRQASGLRAVLQ